MRFNIRESYSYSQCEPEKIIPQRGDESVHTARVIATVGSAMTGQARIHRIE
jgi:hypothetical protein